MSVGEKGGSGGRNDAIRGAESTKQMQMVLHTGGLTVRLRNAWTEFVGGWKPDSSYFTATITGGLWWVKNRRLLGSAAPFN